MTPEQAARVSELRDRGGSLSFWSIPPGSWFAVRRHEGGTWIEVIDPVASCLMAFDFGPEEPLRVGGRALADTLRGLAELVVDEWVGPGGQRLGDGNDRWVAHDRAVALAEALEMEVPES